MSSGGHKQQHIEGGGGQCGWVLGGYRAGGVKGGEGGVPCPFILSEILPFSAMNCQRRFTN